MAVLERVQFRSVEPAVEADSAPSRLRRDTGALTMATVVVGLGNFCYSLLLTWLLPVHRYALFAAAQTLLLAASSIANASLPWVLTHRLSHDPTDEESHRDALAFVVLASALEGLIMAGVLIGVLRSVASVAVLAVVGIDAVVIFAACPATGYLQGAGRFTKLAQLRVADLLAKLASGVALVLLGTGATGALLSISFGNVPLLAFGSAAFRRQLAARWRVLLDRSLWRQTLSLACVQGSVAALASLDLVAATLLWHGRPGVLGSYQVAILCSRVPFFLSAPISQAAFQRLSSKNVPTAAVIGLAIQMMVVLYIPVAVLIATIPRGLVQLVFPHAYSTVTDLLPYTAASGLLLAAVNVFSTFFQARQQYLRCILAMSCGLLDVAAVLLGFHRAGIVGMASGSIVGMGAVFSALAVGAVLTWRIELPRSASVWVPVVLSLPAALLSRSEPVWLVYAVALGLWSAKQAFWPNGPTPLSRLRPLRRPI